jgi:hypothetical protein
LELGEKLARHRGLPCAVAVWQSSPPLGRLLKPSVERTRP